MGVLLYIINIFFSGYIALLTEKYQNRTFRVLSCIIISCLWGSYALMFNINPDFDRSRYITSFYRWIEYREIGVPFYAIEYESGYVLFNYILGYITDNADILIFCTMFLATFFSLYSIQIINRNFFIPIVFFLSTAFIGYSLSVYKQVLAVAFGNMAFAFYTKKKYWGFSFFIALAVLFQAISIVYIAIAIMFLWCNKKWKYMLVICLCLMFFCNGNLITIILGYIPNLNLYIPLQALQFQLGGGTFGSMLKGFPFYVLTLIAFYYRKKLISTIPYGDALIFMSLFSSMAYLLSFNMYWAFRMSFYSLLPLSILVGELWKIISLKQNKIVLITCLFLIFFTSLRYIFLIEI